MVYHTQQTGEYCLLNKSMNSVHIMFMLYHKNTLFFEHYRYKTAKDLFKMLVSVISILYTSIKKISI